MSEILNQYGWWILGAASAAITIIWKAMYQFHWFNFWYDIPLIGKMKRLTDASPDSKDKNWTRSERTLCSDYAKLIQLGDFNAFNNRAEYLRKAGDLGVRPMPAWVNVFLWLLIIAEGFGFAYSLGTWAVMEGSENLFIILMIVLALVIAVPSAWLSHEAGVRFHRWSSLNRYRREWKDAGQEGSFQSAKIPLNNYDQKLDDNQPAYTQYANRRAEKTSLLPLWGAIAWATIVVVMSTTMRISHLETVMAQENVGVEASQTGAVGNPFAGVPAELADPQTKADNKAGAEIKKSTFIEGGAALFMLAFLYLATQGVGAALAAKYAFLGAQSESAYKGNFGFETFDDFIRHYEPIVQIAQSRLQTLQERLGSRDDVNRGLKLHKTFDDYLNEERQKSLERRTQSTSLPQNTTPAQELKPVQEIKEATSTQPIVEEESATDSISLDQAKAHIDSLNDKQAQMDYYAKLPSNIKDDLKPWLKLRKEADAAKQKADLEELF